MTGKARWLLLRFCRKANPRRKSKARLVSALVAEEREPWASPEHPSSMIGGHGATSKKGHRVHRQPWGQVEGASRQQRTGFVGWNVCGPCTDGIHLIDRWPCPYRTRASSQSRGSSSTKGNSTQPGCFVGYGCSAGPSDRHQDGKGIWKRVELDKGSKRASLHQEPFDSLLPFRKRGIFHRNLIEGATTLRRPIMI